MVEKKNPDYSNSAVNLCNPPEIGRKLMDYQDCQAKVRTLEANLQAIPEFQDLQDCQKKLAELNAQIRSMVDAQGSYQDIDNGFYAVKYVRKSKVYSVEPFKEHYPKYVPAVVVETINVKALEGLVKGGLIPEADLEMYKVFTTDISYAYVVR
mgnify:CR=1 FL=1